jgi:hypothetical protein
MKYRSATNIALTMLLLSGKRFLREKSSWKTLSGHPEVSGPIVLDQQFLLGNSFAYWRLDMTPPSLKMNQYALNYCWQIYAMSTISTMVVSKEICIALHLDSSLKVFQ